jgi:hypothetical protein
MDVIDTDMLHVSFSLSNEILKKDVSSVNI